MNYGSIKKECEKIDGVTIEPQGEACQCRIRADVDFSAEDQIRGIVEKYDCTLYIGSAGMRIHKIVPRKDPAKVKPDVK